MLSNIIFTIYKLTPNILNNNKKEYTEVADSQMFGMLLGLNEEQSVMNNIEFGKGFTMQYPLTSEYITVNEGDRVLCNGVFYQVKGRRIQNLTVNTHVKLLLMLSV